MTQLFLNVRAKLAWTWRIGLISKETAHHWRQDAKYGVWT